MGMLYMNVVTTRGTQFVANNMRSYARLAPLPDFRLKHSFANQFTFVGRDVRLPRPLLHILPHVPLAPPLLTSCRYPASVQHVNSPLLRLCFLLPPPGRNRIRPPVAQSKPPYLDCHIDRPTVSLFLHAARYISGWGQG